MGEPSLRVTRTLAASLGAFAPTLCARLRPEHTARGVRAGKAGTWALPPARACFPCAAGPGGEDLASGTPAGPDRVHLQMPAWIKDFVFCIKIFYINHSNFILYNECIHRGGSQTQQGRGTVVGVSRATGGPSEEGVSQAVGGPSEVGGSPVTGDPSAAGGARSPAVQPRGGQRP